MRNLELYEPDLELQSQRLAKLLAVAWPAFLFLELELESAQLALLLMIPASYLLSHL